MFCTNCGTDNPQTAIYCYRCGHRLAATYLADRPTPPDNGPHLISNSNIRSSSAPSRRPNLHVGGMLAIAGATLAAGLLAAARYGVASAGMFGFWLGSLLIPLAIALLISRKNWSRFSWAFSIAVLVCLSISSHDYRTTEQQVRDMIRQAAGTKAVDGTSESAAAKVVRPILREYFISIRTWLADPRCGDINPPLNSPDSFASAETINASLGYLRSCSDKTHDLTAIINNYADRVRAAVQATDWTRPEKSDFLSGFDKGYDESNASLEKFTTAEQKWARSTSAVYVFAGSNRRDYAISDGTLVFSKHSKLVEFNRLADTAEADRQQFLAASHEFQQSSNAYFSKYGLTEQDLALDKTPAH